MGKKVRSATIHMQYKGEDIAAYCTDFSYTSNGYDEADHITATLEDRDGRVWQGDRWPLRGDVLEPVIVVENWRFNGDRHELRCGSFELDSPVFNGPPDTVALQGTAILTRGSAQTEKKTSGWEDVTLSAIAGDIAGRNGYKLDWRGADHRYWRCDQKLEADLAFLSRLAREAGNGIAIADRSIIIVDAEKLDEQKPSFEFNRLRQFAHGKAVVSYQFSSNLHDRYKACSVAWWDTLDGKTYLGKSKDDTVPDGDTLVINKVVKSDAEAEELAKKMLLAKNRPNIIASLCIVGDTKVRGGLTCTLTEFGGFSGKYLIKSAEHRPLNGYTVRLAMQKVKK